VLFPNVLAQTLQTRRLLPERLLMYVQLVSPRLGSLGFKKNGKMNLNGNVVSDWMHCVVNMKM